MRLNGTRENALFFVSRGHEVTGFDLLPQRDRRLKCPSVSYWPFKSIFLILWRVGVGSRHNRSRGPCDPFCLNAVARPVILGKHRATCEKIGPLWSNKTDG